MIYFLIALNLTSLGYFLLHSIRRFGQFNFFIFFALFNFLYTSAIPIEIVLVTKGHLIASTVVSENKLELLILMSTLSNLGFYLGLVLFYRKPIQVPNLKKEKFPWSILILLLFLLFFSFVFLRTYFVNSFKSYHANFSTTYSSPIYAYIKIILFLTSSVISMLLIQKKNSLKIISTLISFLLILFGIFSFDKDPIVFAFIPWLFFTVHTEFYKKVLIKKWMILFLIIIFATLIPITSSIYGIYRGKGKNKVIEYYTSNGIFSSFESQAVLLSFIDQTNSSKKQFGKTYGFGFVSWIPKKIWPKRPESLAESYAKFKIKDWSKGKGLGFSLLAESYLNFGVYGAFIQYFMIGLILGFLKKITMILFSSNQKYANIVFFIWACYELIIMHRGQFNMPSSYIRFMLPIFVFYMAFDRIIPMILTKLRK